MLVGERVDQRDLFASIRADRDKLVQREHGYERDLAHHIVQLRARYPELTDETVEEFLKALRNTAEITRDVPKRFSYPRDIDDDL